MKSMVKSILSSNKTLEKVSRGTWRATRQTIMATKCAMYDFNVTLKQLNWSRGPSDYWTLSSQLIFQYHKLEKGLCLPGPKRFFGFDAAQATCTLMQEWSAAGFNLDHPVYLAAAETLRAYRARLDVTPPPEALRNGLISRIGDILGQVPVTAESSTPIIPQPVPAGAFEALEALAHARRSVRSFDGEPVDFSLVEKALKIAQLSPSACNRQSVRIHFYDEPKAIAQMLALQNGNRGFSETIPLLAVVTADATTFFDASERIEPALDGGLFLMSFILALQSEGLSSCCLNWCVMPDRDRQGHAVGGIPENHLILTFLAIGHAAPQSIVPRSARRPLADVAVRH